jgi:hypothetical protein
LEAAVLDERIIADALIDKIHHFPQGDLHLDFPLLTLPPFRVTQRLLDFSFDTPSVGPECLIDEPDFTVYQS